jgi:ATP-dependent exoDNAse (exonuclease V) beta subunit
VTEIELEQAARFFGQLALWSGQPDWTGTGDLGERLGSLFAEESAVAGQAVQIMTIHRAKGLEFDVVIVPGLGRPPRTDPEPLLRWLELPAEDGAADLLVAPVSVRGLDAEPLNAYLKLLRHERLANERARLAYVAATRARNELHLFCDLPAPVNSTASAEPRTGTLLATLWPAVAAQLPETAARSRSDLRDADETWRQPSYRLRADWQSPAIAGPTPRRAFDIPKQSLPAPDFAWATQAARSAGRVVHELLQEFGRRGQPPDREAVLDARERIVDRLLQLGLSRSELRRARTRVVEALLACAVDPRGRWLFAREHRAVASPLELSGVVDGRLVNVSIDRSFIDTDDIRWLVDFKVGVHQEPDVETFVASELERYRPQLERTAALASRLGPEPVHVGLYFPLLKVFRKIR